MDQPRLDWVGRGRPARPGEAAPASRRGQQAKPFNRLLDWRRADYGAVADPQVRRARRQIDINLVGQTFNSIIGERSAVRADSGPGAVVVLAFGGLGQRPGLLSHTGEPLFATGAMNPQLPDQKMDQLITATHTSGSMTTFHDYATYGGRSSCRSSGAPNPWQDQAVSSKLHNVTFNAFPPCFLSTSTHWQPKLGCTVGKVKAERRRRPCPERGGSHAGRHRVEAGRDRRADDTMGRAVGDRLRSGAVRWADDRP
jgi:hypothetical protein